MALCLQKLVSGVGEITLKSIHLQFQGGTLVDIATAVDVHIALGIDGVVGDGVFHTVCADHGVCTAQFSAAFQDRIDVGLASDLFGLDVGGQLIAQGGRNHLFQPRA